MVYLFGGIGFFLGFFAGQLLLLRLLKDRSREDLLKDSSLKWTYGLLNWMTAGLGAWLGVTIYTLYLAG